VFGTTVRVFRSSMYDCSHFVEAYRGKLDSYNEAKQNHSRFPVYLRYSRYPRPAVRYRRKGSISKIIILNQRADKTWRGKHHRLESSEGN
jgi:hypothetical protein